MRLLVRLATPSWRADIPSKIESIASNSTTRNSHFLRVSAKGRWSIVPLDGNEEEEDDDADEEEDATDVAAADNDGDDDDDDDGAEIIMVATRELDSTV